MASRLWDLLLSEPYLSQVELWERHRDMIVDEHSSTQLCHILTANTYMLSSTDCFTVMDLVEFYEKVQDTDELYQLLDKLLLVTLNEKMGFPDFGKIMLGYLASRDNVIALNYLRCYLSGNGNSIARSNIEFVLILHLSQLMFDKKIDTESVLDVINECRNSEKRDSFLLSLPFKKEWNPSTIDRYLGQALVGASANIERLESLVKFLYLTYTSEGLLGIYVQRCLRVRIICESRYITVGRVIHRLGGKHVTEYDTSVMPEGTKTIVNDKLFFFDEDKV